MKSVSAVLACAVLVLLPAFICGCASDRPPKKIIGVSVLTLTHQFFLDISDALKAEANKHGYDVVLVSGEFDVVKQDKQVKDFLVRRVDAIVLAPCDSKAIGAVIADANAAGVPVFTVDIGCLAPGVKVVTHVATDNYAGGKQAAEAMIEALGPSGGKVAIIDHRAVESCILRVKGFKEVIAAHNKKPGVVGKIEIVTELPGGGAKAQAFKAAEDLLQQHEDLAGIFGINDDTALGAGRHLKRPAGPSASKSSASTASPRASRPSRTGKSMPIRFNSRGNWGTPRPTRLCGISRARKCRPRSSFRQACIARRTRSRSLGGRECISGGRLKCISGGLKCISGGLKCIS